jgi:hypothetical protein
LKLLLITLVILLLQGCNESEEWALFYYSDASKVPSAVDAHKFIAGKFKSFEDCQASGISKVRSSGLKGAYECGLNCEMNSDYGVLICKTTRK